MISTLWQYTRDLMFSAHGAIAEISLVAFIWDVVLGNELFIPSWVFVAVIVIVLYWHGFRTHQKNLTLSNPDVDFKVLSVDEVGIINHRWITDLRTFKEVGEFELSAKLQIVNKRSIDTRVKFETKKVSTDLPVLNETGQIRVSGDMLSSGDTLTLRSGQIADVYFSLILKMSFQPLEKTLPQISHATRFQVLINAIQGDGGNSEFSIAISNPAKEFSRCIVDDVARWIDHPPNKHGAAGGQQIVEYLRLLWKGQ